MDSYSARLPVGKPYGSLPVPGYGALYEFAGWVDADGETVFETDLVPDVDIVLYASVKPGAEMEKVLAALGGNVEARLDPDAPWFVQGEEVHDGDTALQSAAVADGGRSEIAVSFSGSGALSFWHKVSSEQNYDKLTIVLDGVQEGEYSGESGWTEFRRDLGDGEHELVLSYSKDGSQSRGADAAWMADFSWRPAGCPVTVEFDATVASVKTADGTPVSSGETFAVGAEGMSFTVKAADWRSPLAGVTDGSMAVETADPDEANEKTFLVTPTAGGTLAFFANPYSGDGEGMIEVGGKRVPAAKATGWGIAYGVAESGFGDMYGDYLLNARPESGGGFKVSGIMADASAGTLAIVVTRTGGEFSFDSLNGTLTIQAADAPAGPYAEVAAEAVSVESGKDSATVTMAIPAGNVRFFKAVIR